jgi:hypothetical protein
MYEITVVLVGLLAGALLTEGMVLVPFWRKMPAEQFYDLHHLAGPRLFRFFAPLTMLGVIAPVALAILNPVHIVAAIAAVLCVLALLSFFVFFKDVNIKLSKQQYEYEELPDVLRRWAIWHHSRTGLVLIAFLILVLQPFE